ncbi:MAG: Asp-tRNA(Asn)/Glu-tRNA(Gln) amidotransferase subunit GatC [Candidatus Nealsonbacteria bacterium]|nr:Asp-tRNA(Asn)/Glu-tRNA(Gln) amidotransferase subunit GatC [Candidatus Nealsonbacteria bacterium]
MISKDDAKKVAKLARLGISEKEAVKFQKELSAVLEYFKMINEVNVSKIEPTFHSAEDFLGKDKLTRKDKAIPENEATVKKIIESSPDKKERYIKVKAIL